MKAKKKQLNIPDPWVSMEQLFNEGFPFSGLTKQTEFMVNPEWVERFVHEAQETHIQSKPSQSKELYEHSIYETHKSLIIRIKIPPSLNPELLRLYVKALSLRVAGFPNQAEKKIRFPCEVNTVGIRSSFKDGILEIRMLKKLSTDQERQISIAIQ